jgi:hypothetical protein
VLGQAGGDERVNDGGIASGNGEAVGIKRGCSGLVFHGMTAAEPVRVKWKKAYQFSMAFQYISGSSIEALNCNQVPPISPSG